MDKYTVAVWAFSVVMVGGLFSLFASKLARGAAFGELGIKFAIMLVLIPTVAILALVGIFNAQTTAALLGAMAGYAGL